MAKDMNSPTANELVFLARLKEKFETNGVTDEEKAVYNAVRALLYKDGESTAEEIKAKIEETKTKLSNNAEKDHQDVVKKEQEYWKAIEAFKTAVKQAANVDPSKTEVNIPHYPGTFEEFRKRNADHLDEVKKNLIEIEVPKLNIDGMAAEARLKGR